MILSCHQKVKKIIENFREIRRDSKVIDDSMTANDIFSLGFAEKIVEIQWYNEAQLVSVRDDDGFLAKVVPGREFVVVNRAGEFRWFESRRV